MARIYHVEPEGRLINTIGRELIKDVPAAIVELVKNAYDADATEVKIEYLRKNKSTQIIVTDDGHGMSEETLVNSWLIPATSYKLEKKESPKGRKYQGKKGIGRYAVSLLGNKLDLETVYGGNKIFSSFDWNKFYKAKKITDVPVKVENIEGKFSDGTKLTIINEVSDTGDEVSLGEKDVRRVEKELAKLLSNNLEDFHIFVKYTNFFDDQSKNITIPIEEYKTKEAYHYRLSGNVDEDFNYNFKYENRYTNYVEDIVGNFKRETIDLGEKCGNLHFDYKVYDKDIRGIELIKDFLNGNTETGNELTSRETKKMLVESSGVSIYRDNFRIRPYGDKGFDWLNLDSKRIQSPSMHIGFDQINGQIDIQDEDKSGLKEKSARDGLYENNSYFTLQKLASLVLGILERKRFQYRNINKEKKREKSLEDLFNFDEVNVNIGKEIEKTFVDLVDNPDKASEYKKKLQKDISNQINTLEKKKKKEYEKVKEEVITYQKQVTLGNVLTVVLHEGRNTLSWYTTKIPTLLRQVKKLEKYTSIPKEYLEKVLKNLSRLEDASKSLSGLFKRLDPLSSASKRKRENVDLSEEVSKAVEIFKKYASSQNIEIGTEYVGVTTVSVVREDIYMTLTNLLENSVFWTGYGNAKSKKILVRVEGNDLEVVVDIINNGPAISKEVIENGTIFVPGYSEKDKINSDESGTGLGLAISGEAIARNKGVLEAIDSKDGAHFRIRLKKR